MQAKSKLLRLLSLSLAIVMLLVALSACATTNEGSDTGNNGSAAENASEAETKTPAEATLDRIGNPDWGKNDFGILYLEGVGTSTAEMYSEGYSVGSESTTTAVLNDAVYERNTLFAQRCNLNLILIGKPNGSIQGAVTNELHTQSHEFSMLTNTLGQMAGLATSGYLYNYLSMDDIEWDMPWWDRGTIEFAIDGKVFFMNGSHNILDDDVTFLTIFNKKLVDQYQVHSPYDTVHNGEWTIDYFSTLIAGISAENGDGKWDENDTYGFCAPDSIGAAFFYGSGLQYIINNRDMDMPELALTDNMAKAEQVLDKVRGITLANNSSYIAPAGSEAKAMNMFKEERAMFYIEAASYLGNLNAVMEGIYGALPIPKYDKAQENYLTYTHSIGSTLSLPADVEHSDIIGDIVETFTVLSYQKVKPAYYDNMLTARNIHDAESAEMLDIIFRNRVYDMATYFSEFGMDSLFTKAALSSSSNFSSGYASASKRFDRTVKNMMNKFKKLDKNKS